MPSDFPPYLFNFPIFFKFLPIFRCSYVLTLIFFSPVSTGIGPQAPSHCPNGRLGQDLGFGGFAFALKLPELLNTNLPTVMAKLGQTYSFLNGPQIWFPIGQ